MGFPARESRRPHGLRNLYPELVGVVAGFEDYCLWGCIFNNFHDAIPYLVPRAVFERLTGKLLLEQHVVYPSPAAALNDLNKAWDEFYRFQKSLEQE